MATPRYGHGSIKMRRVDKFGDIEQAGDFCWIKDDDGQKLAVAIPAANGNYVHSTWPISPATTAAGHTWTRDANDLNPSLHPSLHAVGVWHGWVLNGALVEA